MSLPSSQWSLKSCSSESMSSSSSSSCCSTFNDFSGNVHQVTGSGMNFPSGKPTIQIAASHPFQIPFGLDLPSPFSSDGLAYFLVAPTSPLTYTTQEPVAFLSQGHLYKIIFQNSISGSKNSNSSNVLLKTFLRVTFQDRGLERLEVHKVSEWKSRRPTDRMLEIDEIHSDNLLKIFRDPDRVNVVSLTWNSSRPPVVFFRVNCVGSEFTSKRNGGQKGVAFKLMMVTILLEPTTNPEAFLPDHQLLLHCASAFVKVFKSSGAERKAVMEKEKLEKLQDDKKKHFRPSSDCMKFTDISISDFLQSQQQQLMMMTMNSNGNSNLAPSPAFPFPLPQEESMTGGYLSPSLPPPPHPHPPPHPSPSLPTPAKNFLFQPVQFPSSHDDEIDSSSSIHRHSTSAEVVRWLRLNGFDTLLIDLKNFSGSDLLRLSDGDFFSISKKTAEAVRLKNALHSKRIRSRRRIYVRLARRQKHNAPTGGGGGGGGSNWNQSSVDLSSSPGSSFSSFESVLSSQASCNLSFFDGNSGLSSCLLPWETNLHSLDLLSGTQPLTDNHNHCYDNSFHGDSSKKRKRCSASAEEKDDDDDDIIIDVKEVYHSVYLDVLSVVHLVEQLAELCRLSSPDLINLLYFVNSNGNFVYATDKDVQNLEDESSFILHILPDSGQIEKFTFILLKTSSRRRHSMSPIQRQSSSPRQQQSASFLGNDMLCAALT